MPIKNFYLKNQMTIIIGIVVVIVATVILGVIFFPTIFYDNWIWKYYWGPVVADAQGGVAFHNGVKAEEGYTIVSEITYGIILIISLYAIYVLLKRLKIKIDWKFALALLPYIIFGPVGRTLEDTGYFTEPFVYWFISPLIYLQIAAYAILFLLVGKYLENRYKNKNLTTNRVIFIGGLIFLIPSLYLIAQWIIGNQWSTSNGVRFDLFALIISIISVIIIAMYAIATKFKNNEKIAIYRNPLNLAMVFGHLIDGLTSYFSIYDPLNMGLPLYSEKHPASNLLMEIWPPLFPIVKFLLIIIVIYLFDVYYKKELKNYLNLVNLLKIGILILGFSPGLRDLLRVTMGV